MTLHRTAWSSEIDPAPSTGASLASPGVGGRGSDALEVLAASGRHLRDWPGIPVAVACPDERRSSDPATAQYVGSQHFAALAALCPGTAQLRRQLGRLQRHDLEDWVVRSDRLKRLDGLVPVDGDVRSASRHPVDVPPDHRRPIIHRNLDEQDHPRPASAQGRLTPCGAHVADPVALTEHRDDIPLAPDVRHANGESGDPPCTSAAHLERDPAPWQKPQVDRHDPEPCIASGRRVTVPSGIHRPQPVPLPPAHDRTSRRWCPGSQGLLATVEPVLWTALPILEPWTAG